MEQLLRCCDEGHSSQIPLSKNLKQEHPNHYSKGGIILGLWRCAEPKNCTLDVQARFVCVGIVEKRNWTLKKQNSMVAGWYGEDMFSIQKNL
mmetsp:Transcript_21137/g.27292  ORF Transcript_21137/g.27292 Transcript_21137/m.27292 type:complete len:92 (+) Transcript_21137:306-581(+)